MLHLKQQEFEPAYAGVEAGFETSVEVAFNVVALVDLGVLVLALPGTEALLGKALFEVAAPGLEKIEPTHTIVSRSMRQCNR